MWMTIILLALAGIGAWSIFGRSGGEGFSYHSIDLSGNSGSIFEWIILGGIILVGIYAVVRWKSG